MARQSVERTTEKSSTTFLRRVCFRASMRENLELQRLEASLFEGMRYILM